MVARTILVAVPKGGSGKSTTVQTLALAFAEQGRRVLCVDTDPQGNLSSVLGYLHKRSAPTLYTVLREFAFNRRRTLPSAIFHLAWPNQGYAILDSVPTTSWDRTRKRIA